MSLPMSGGSIFVVIVLFLIVVGFQVYVGVKVALGVMRVYRGFTQAGKIAEMLTPETRSMLLRRGIDPARLTRDFEELNDEPELRQRVAADVGQAVKRMFLPGRGDALVRRQRGEPPRTDTEWPAAPRQGEPIAAPMIPEPFDAPRSGSGRTIALALGAGLAVAVLARLFGWA